MSRAFWSAGLTTILMQSIAQQSVAFFRRLADRVRSWRAARWSRTPVGASDYLSFPGFPAAIHRDVTSQGVRVYSLCCDCGCRLNASATLCDECAQKRSRPARPF